MCELMYIHTHTHVQQQKPSITAVNVPKPLSHRPVGRPRVHSSSSHATPLALPAGKVLASKEGMCEYVCECVSVSFEVPLYIAKYYTVHACVWTCVFVDSDMEYAECMRRVLTAVEGCELVALLEQTRLSSVEQAEHADSDAAGQSLLQRGHYT